MGVCLRGLVLLFLVFPYLPLYIIFMRLERNTRTYIKCNIDDSMSFPLLRCTICTIATIVKHDMSATTTIQVKTNTRDTLRKIGHMGDDYNTVIERLIVEHNRNSLVEHGKQIVEERKNEFVNIDDL